ncbi:amidohydrolase [Salibacterium halotolerans]|uniref:5-methylthioadenosine/S-adenosylhomocysteine deaminase n=1 Tax=Salibacterium halotolerans TaxID=1884432 RepID=A0A1I5Q978_9BACI|nr:amidohydrolase [Salibacterium halotolerans]SFP42707.1 5-methylthioadenosine/S-adenosylhomocysteine deaminase [Salibacterium halotolerans]
MQHFIIEDIHLLPDGSRESVQKNCYMEIKDGIIAEVETMPVPDHKHDLIPRIQGKGRWVLPGMYNTHMHTPMTLLRGTADDVPLKEWLEKEIWPREAELDRDMVQAGTDLALAEMIRSGTTAFLDMYHLHMDLVFEQTRQAGMKAVLSRGMIGFGGQKEWEAKLSGAVELAHYWNKEGNGKIKGMLFPHAPYTCPPAFMTQIASAAREHDLMIGTHAAETAGEVEEYKENYGRTPAAHLDDLGFYEQQAVLTHGVHVSEEEISLLQKKRAFISHNPMSNAKLGSGTAPISRFLEAGIPVTLGTDSSASNNNLDMFQEMRMAALMQKGVRMDPGAVGAEDIFRMATRNGAHLLGFEGDGLLQPGGPADFIMLDAEKPHLQPEHHMVSHVVYAASGQDVTDVFVDGNQLMKDRELVTIDEERILYNARYQHEKLEQRR